MLREYCVQLNWSRFYKGALKVDLFFYFYFFVKNKVDFCMWVTSWWLNVCMDAVSHFASQRYDGPASIVLEFVVMCWSRRPVLLKLLLLERHTGLCDGKERCNAASIQPLKAKMSHTHKNPFFSFCFQKSSLIHF